MLKQLFEQLPPGSFTYEDAEVIVRSLNRIKAIKGDCLEIGSDLGRSSTLVAEIVKGNSHLFCVDIWSNETWAEMASQLGEEAEAYPRRDPRAFEIFNANIKKRGLDAVVTPIRNKSEEAIKEFKNPLKFIFIDGCHEYEYVKKDIEWVKYLVEGGEVVFHDYIDKWPGVKAAVNEFASNRSFKLADSGGNCVCLKKRTSEYHVSDSSQLPSDSAYSSGSKRIKIAAITMVYNEALLLPHFLRHYEYLDEIHVLYETDSTDDTLRILKQASNVIIKNCHAEGGLDSMYKVNLMNNTLHTIEADWVYVVDCDEFIFPPRESPEDFLSRQDRESYTVVRAGMFQVYRHRNDNDLDMSLPPIPQRVHGDPDLFSTVRGPNKDPNVNYVKPIVVKPSSEIRFQPGNHIVEGDMRVSPEFYLGSHWQMADPSIAIDRRIKNRVRMSERNKKLGMGYQHWDITDEWIRAECDRHLDDPIIEELKLFNNRNLKSRGLLTMRVMYKAAIFELEKQKGQLQALEAKLASKDARIAKLRKDVWEKLAEANRLEARIQQIEQSIPMQLVSRYQRIVERLLRSGTRRRHYYELGLSGIRIILNEGWKSFFSKARNRLAHGSSTK